MTKPHCLGRIPLALALLLVPSLVIPGKAMAEALSGHEQRITYDPAPQLTPAVSGSRIVWTDRRNGNSDIYFYDAATDERRPITTHPAGQFSPAISGTRVAWCDRRDGGTSVYLYDLESELEPQPIAETSPLPFSLDCGVHLSGDRIVWQRLDTESGNYVVELLDLSTGELVPITDGTHSDLHPRISGDRIVWDRSGVGVFAYDLQTMTEEALNTLGLSNWWPDVSGDGAIWLLRPLFGEAWIEHLDLATGEGPTRIESDDIGVIFQPPRISGNWVVWTDDRNGIFNTDIFLWDLSTGVESAVTTADGQQQLPAISGGRIVWQDDRHGNSDIYMFEFDTDPTIEELRDQVGELEAGSLLRPGLAEAMRAQLDQAAAALARDNQIAAERILNAFVRFVQGLAHEQLDEAPALELTELTEAVLASL